ncbi:hypothetical protein V8F33_010135 [Rhypophila sp. PSN 637]
MSPSAVFEEAPEVEANSIEEEPTASPSSAHARSTSPAEKSKAESPRAESAEPIGRESREESGGSSPEEGLIDESADQNGDTTGDEHTAPPLPEEAPPLPNEAPPDQASTYAYVDDGWQPYWNTETGSWWFYNKYNGAYQAENPRVPGADSAAAVAPAAHVPVVVPPETDATAISDLTSVAGGYNPAIHGSYDPNAWYAQNSRAAAAQEAASGQFPNGYQQYATAAYFNRATGQWQMPEMGAERHSDEAKSKRQMNAYFDVDAAANQHDGRSLKAERSGKKPTKAELKAFKEKRKAKKEEKRRAWLRD